jgi:hypothetical protein
MTDLANMRRRHILLIDQSGATLGHILSRVSQETATTLRDAHDGPKGWTVLEVVCHLRDFDAIFRNRAVMMRDQDYPTLPHFDHEELARQGRYNDCDLRQAYAELAASRRQTIAFFKELDAEQWERAGLHHERGHFTMDEAVVQVGTHDINHLEQITRILFHNV